MLLFQISRQALQPVDHLTGKMVGKCLSSMQALNDEREQIQTKLQVRKNVSHAVSNIGLHTHLLKFKKKLTPPPKRNLEIKI